MRRLVAAAAALLCCPAAVGLTGSTTSAAPGASPGDTARTSTSTGERVDDRSDRPDRSERKRKPDRPTRSSSRGVDADEVEVTIRGISSTYLERREPITIAGTVRNPTDQDWTDVQGYLTLGDAPLSDSDALADYAESESDTPSGERISSLRDFTEIGRVDAGETKRFRVRVRPKAIRERIGAQPQNGVYQVGVHLRSNARSGSRVTIGRARTFMPYLDRRSARQSSVEVSMVWPFTTDVRRAADGTYPDASTLVDEISTRGRLGRMLQAAEDAPARSITLMIDPALLDALSAIARDSYGPPDDTSDQGSLLSDDADGNDAQELANSYLSRLRSVAQGQDVWATPYAQPDLDALASHTPEREAQSVYEASESAAQHVMSRFGTSGRVAYMPPDGIADLESLQWAQSHTDTSDPATQAPAAILSPEMLNGWDASESPLVSIDADNQTIPAVVDDGVVSSGGPLPGKSDSALQVRQRLASEAAIRAIERESGASSTGRVAVVLDPEWNPGPATQQVDLFDALDTSWTTPVSPDRQLNTAPDWRGPIGVTDSDRQDPLSSEQVDTAGTVVRDANYLSALVEGGGGLAAYYQGTASAVVSQSWRDDPIAADDYADEARDSAGSQLDRVSIEGPGFVSFSGNSGPLPVTVHNGLDVPIRVGVAVQAEGADLDVPNLDPVEVQPGQSPSFTIDADIGEVSNTAFHARLTTPDGEPFGPPAEFNVRSSVVGMAVWIGMGVAGLLVVLALVRQIRRRRGGHSLPGETEP